MSEAEIQQIEDRAHWIRGFLHVPAVASGNGLVLAHGAGGNCESPLLTAVAREFCVWGFLVLRCDLPFRQLRPHGPPPRGSAERDQQGLREATASLRRLISGRLFLGGHSYGGRQASMLAAREPGLLDGLLLLSYPLHPPRRPDQKRTNHFPQLQTPALFVQGTRDGFASIAEFEEALTLIPARTALLSISGAGHELMRKRDGPDLPKLIVEEFRAFFAS